MSLPPEPQLAALAEVHRALGIPGDYAERWRLPFHPEAPAHELIDIGQRADGRVLRLIAPAAAAWQQLRHDATDAGMTLLAVSAFRSVARQAELIQEKRSAGETIESILRYVAAPGFSEHHTGRALDLESPDHPALDEGFAQTATFRWLDQHASRYGFHLSYPAGSASGIGYEPWHWCWRG